MRWAAIFTDRPDGAEIRAQFTSDHQAFLRENKGAIVLAGALRDKHGGTAAGGLWIFEADTREDVAAIIAKDPFVINGLRATQEIFAWGTAPGFEDMVITQQG